jgi:hypothetical protein
VLLVTVAQFAPWAPGLILSRGWPGVKRIAISCSSSLGSQRDQASRVAHWANTGARCASSPTWGVVRGNRCREAMSAQSTPVPTVYSPISLARIEVWPYSGGVPKPLLNFSLALTRDGGRWPRLPSATLLFILLSKSPVFDQKYHFALTKDNPSCIRKQHFSL